MKHLTKVYIIVFSVLFILSACYIQHKNLIKTLDEDSEKLIKHYQAFSYDYYDIVPKNIEDFEMFLNWIRLTSGSQKLDFNFLNYGYGIKYDSLKKSSIIYCFGRDKIDNNLNFTPYNTHKLNVLGKRKFKKQNFIEYVFNFFKQKDIVLICVKANSFECENKIDQLEYNPFFSFQLYKNEKNIWTNKVLKQRFLKFIGDFQRNYSTSYYRGKFETKNKIFVKFKNNEIHFLCSNSFTENQLNFLKIELENYFSNNELFFDYAIFSLDMIFDPSARDRL